MAVISNDRRDMEYMVKKLREKYEKWRLTVNIRKTKYLCIHRAEAENLVIENNRTKKSKEFARNINHEETSSNREEIDDQEVSNRMAQACSIIACLNDTL
jgi:hypothetical protein